MDRRTFLATAAASAAAALAACGDATEPSAAAPTPAETPAELPTVGATSASGPSSDTELDTTAEAPAAPEQAAATSQPADAPSTGTAEPAPLTPAMFEALAVCVASNPQPEGPFPTRSDLNRRVIHEDYPGQPLRLGLRIVDGACKPIPGAVVDIWHCDASGDYSEYTDNGSGKDEAEGSTFCRGFQAADADGIVEFETIYPGWYEGRAVHIHAAIHVDGQRALTTQLYFDEEYTSRIHAFVDAYAEFGQPDTSWSRDGLAGNPATDGTGLTLTDAETALGPGTLGLINIGV